MHVSSSDQCCRYEGRVVHGGDSGARFDWPLVAVSIRVRCLVAGPVAVLLDGAANRFSASVRSEDGWDPTVDHHAVFTAASPGTVKVVVIGHIPGQGVFTLRLRKLTEPSHSGVPRLGGCLGRALGMQGVACFRGWQLPEGSTALPPAARCPRRIEMLGGSDTCGFGADLAAGRNLCSALVRNEVHNAELCYSAQLARRLRAEVHVVAWSGKGVVQNAFHCCGVFGREPLPALLGRALATSPEARWHFGWVPHLVLIDCGGNDYNNVPPTPEERFVSGYLAMLTDLRSRYPEARLPPLHPRRGPRLHSPPHSSSTRPSHPTRPGAATQHLRRVDAIRPPEEQGGRTGRACGPPVCGCARGLCRGAHRPGLRRRRARSLWAPQ